MLMEIFGYGVVSVVALGVDTTTLWLLATAVGFHYLLAATISFTLGATVSYLLSTRFVFRYREVGNRALEFFYFVALGLVGLLVNAAVLSVAISGVGVGLLTAKALAALCTFFTNFFLRRRLLFSLARAGG